MTDGYTRVKVVRISCATCGRWGWREEDTGTWVTVKDKTVTENRYVHFCSTKCEGSYK